jgi:hypothetical protein
VAGSVQQHHPGRRGRQDAAPGGSATASHTSGPANAASSADGNRCWRKTGAVSPVGSSTMSSQRVRRARWASSIRSRSI